MADPRIETDHLLNECSNANLTAVRGEPRVWVWCAFVVATIALAGSLLLSLVLGLKACPLCFYQRTFIMSLVGVLGIGLLTGAGRGARLGLLALPLAAAGMGVAAFHVFLEATGTLECPNGVFNLGTAPQQSLAMFLVVFGLLLGDVLTNPLAGNERWPALFAAIAVGGLLAVASCTSNPPMPEAPRQPYPKAPEICRPPYRAS